MANLIRYGCILFLLILGFKAQTQYLYSIHSRWNDDFSEWMIFAEDDETEYFLGIKWPLRNDWTEWEYEIGDHYGNIKLKWRDNPNLWEVREDHNPVSARTVWTNDFSEWRITQGDIKLTLQSKWKNSINEWRVKEDKYGSFVMKTEYSDDPRDWQIYDELDTDIGMDIKMTLVFLVVYNSFPKL